MRVFVTVATSFIGPAIALELINAGLERENTGSPGMGSKHKPASSPTWSIQNNSDLEESFIS
jgi:nucleoside-diphosphate-sugar epimerase